MDIDARPTGTTAGKDQQVSLSATILEHQMECLVQKRDATQIDKEDQAYVKECMQHKEEILLLLKQLKINPSTLVQGSCKAPTAQDMRGTPPGESAESVTQETPASRDDTGGATIFDDEEGWQLGRPHKRKQVERTAREQGSTIGRRFIPTRTVVLKPVCKQGVKTFSSRDIQAALEKAGIRNRDGFAVHLHEKANTIAITTKNQLLAQKFMQITEIQGSNGICEMRPYQAMASNQVRGVIYLHGSTVNETPESLMEGLECRTHRVIAARPMGRGGKTILVTFEGNTTPRHVRFLCESLRVAAYNPRPLVCYECHEIGHKSDVCPNKARRCSKCGHEHGDMEECELDPKCHNCGGPHVALSNECPKRQLAKKPPSRVRARKSQQTPAWRNNAENTTVKQMATPPISAEQGSPRNTQEHQERNVETPGTSIEARKPPLWTTFFSQPQATKLPERAVFTWPPPPATSVDQPDRLTVLEKRMDKIEGMLTSILQILGRTSSHE